MAFIRTATGYRADAEQIAFWESRDTCPACSAVVEPVGKAPDGQWRYSCRCETPAVEWTRPV